MDTDAIEAYEANTVDGVPIREIARQRGVHASTVLRQTRRVEEAREDKVFDLYLTAKSEGAEMPTGDSLSHLIDMARRPHHEVIVAHDLSVAGVRDTRMSKIVESIPVVSVGALVGKDT